MTSIAARQAILDDKEIHLSIIVSLVLTLFLFFMDEGLYSFTWMTNWGAWIIFVIYASVLMVSQLIALSIGKIFLKKYSPVICRILGIIIGLYALLGIIF